MFAFVNNEFIAEDKAFLKVSDLAIQRGYGVFDFFRLRNNVPLFLEDYLDRFFNSATYMRLQITQTREELTAIIDALIKKNNLPGSGIKLILTGGYSPESYEPVDPNLIVLQQKLQLPKQVSYDTGVKIISHEYQRDLPSVKSINYLMGVWLLQKIKEQGAADVLYCSQGIISELPRANIFMISHDEKIITPSENILQGITRKKLLELAANNFPVEIRPVHIDEMRNAAEVFITSTTKRLLPVNQVDDTLIGNGKAGPITSLLQQSFIKMEEQWLRF